MSLSIGKQVEHKNGLLVTRTVKIYPVSARQWHKYGIFLNRILYSLANFYVFYD